jgi:uncharacterized membrane protein
MIQRHFVSKFGILLVAFFLFAAAHAADAYSFTDVNYPGAVWTVAQEINDSRQIVGYYADTAGGRHGFLLSGGTYTTIDCPSPYTISSSAFGINNLGQIVGVCSAPGGVSGFYGSSRSFIVNGGVLSFLPDAPGSYGGASTAAQGINDSGQIVGWYADSCLCKGHGFLLSGGIYTTIDVPGFGSTYARGINNVGEIVGGTQQVFGGGFEQAFTLNNGTYTNFNDPAVGPSSSSEADGINSLGHSVGFYSDVNGVTHGFLLDGGVFTNVDHPNALLTEALGINSQEQIVGAYNDAANVTHGFVTAPIVPFATFKVDAGIDQDQNTSFEIDGHFTLGAGSAGINLLTEDVKLQVGTFSTAIPSGSFEGDGRNTFEFEGLINGVELKVTIYHVRDNRFLFTAIGKGANMTGTVNPVTVVLTIGDNTGSAKVIADLDK